MGNINKDIILILDDDFESFFTTALSGQESVNNGSLVATTELGILKQIKKKDESEALHQMHSTPDNKIYANLLKTINSCWIGPKVIQDHHKLPTPKAYSFKQIYDKNRKMLLNQQQENERKLREFHARPMPNFNLAHQIINNKQLIHRITCPKTPNVLKTSIQAEAKRKEQLEQLQKEKEKELLNMLKSNFKAQAVPNNKFSLYKMEPFKPSNRQSLINMKPFNLKSEERGRQRKLFDEQNMKILQEKNRRQEDENKKRELELKQRQRLLTAFRARPNPFMPQQK